MTAKAQPIGPFDTVLLGPDIDAMPQPVNAPYFVVARQGAFVYKKMFFGWVMVPVKEIPTLPKMEGRAVLWLDVPPLPTTMLGQAWSFFRWAWDERKSEAMLDITWSEQHGYRFFIPPQTASAGGVKCIRNPEHYVDHLIGTIHSHCNGSAYHSSTDTHDADEHDGLHITMGRVSANKPELDFMVSANHERWDKIKMTEVTGKGKTNFKRIAHPEWWQTFHEHPAAVDKFKHTTFAAGGKPGYGNQPVPFTPNREYNPFNHNRYGSHKQSPFSDFSVTEFGRLMDLMLKDGLVPVDDRLNFTYSIDALAEDLHKLIEEAEEWGIRINLKAYADRTLLNKPVKDRTTKPATFYDDNERFWYGDEEPIYPHGGHPK